MRFASGGGIGRLRREMLGLACREAVAPGRLHQHAPGVAVAGERDRALASAPARGVLARHQPEEGHQLLGRVEAADVAELCQQYDGGEFVDAAQCHQRIDHRRQRPLRQRTHELIGELGDPLAGGALGVDVRLQNDLLPGILELQPGQPVLMRRRPAALPLGQCWPWHSRKALSC